MRILVTGGGGFAGQHLLRLLVAGGHEVTAGTLPGDVPEQGPLSEEERARVRWIALDVTDSASVRDAVEASAPQRVYHLAGQASVAQSFADPLATWEVNAMGTVRVLEELRRRGDPETRALVISSAEVYGAVPVEEQPTPESAPLRPLTPYGASKAAAEMAAWQAVGAGVPVVVARSFNHTGPGQDARFALPSMARQLARMKGGPAGQALRVGNLEARRDFLDVRDVVRAYECLMERGGSGEAYNVCSGEARSLLEVVRLLVELSGTGARIEVDPERFRPVDIPLLVGDATRLRSLGWQPRFQMARTLSDLLEAAAHE